MIIMLPIDGYGYLCYWWLPVVIYGYYWHWEIIFSNDNGYHGYWWLSMVIYVYLNSAMVILVIGGYQWLLVTLSD